jgi:RNA polymerase sigma-70 factor (ECF subfamily)
MGLLDADKTSVIPEEKRLKGSRQQNLLPCDELPDVISEPFPPATAIPNTNQCWCLPEMDITDLQLEDDGKLLQLMAVGEERGFVSLYRKYQARVYRFSLQVSGIPQIAEEVTQETFLALMRAPSKYQAERGSLLLYLFGIARNLAWKSARRSRLFAALDDDQDLVVHVPDLAGDMARREQVRRVREAVLSLPRKYREVIVLCSLQEFSYEEAASVVGSSIGTVRSRMHRAKRLLLRKLSEGGLAEEGVHGSSALEYEL